VKLVSRFDEPGAHILEHGEGGMMGEIQLRVERLQ
jgi:hypothetical protein